MDISITVDVDSVLRSPSTRDRTICGRCRSLLRASLSRVSSFRLTVQILFLLSFIICTTAAPHHIRHSSSHSSISSSSSSSSTDSLTSSSRHFDPYSPCSGGGAEEDGTAYAKRRAAARDVTQQTRGHVTEAMHHVIRIRRQTVGLKTRYADARFHDTDTTRDLEGFTFDRLPKPFQENSLYKYGVRDIVETAYHDLATLLYFLREAELHEDLHEHASFLDDIKEIRSEVLGMLCRFKILDSMHDFGISAEVSASVVPPEVSNLSKKSSMRKRDYVIFHHLDKYLSQLERDLYTLLEDL